MDDQQRYPHPAALFSLDGVAAPPGPPGERIRVLRPPALPHTEWVVAAGSARHWRRVHEDYDLCVVPAECNPRDAGASYTYRRWTVDARPGAVYLWEPDTLHASRTIFGPTTAYVVKVGCARIAALAEELHLGSAPHFRTPSNDSPRLRAALDRLCGAMVADASSLEQETRLCLAIRIVLTESAEQAARMPLDPSSVALRAVRDHLHAHATADVPIADLERISGLTRFHLIRSFSRMYGVAPHAYQNALRVAEARRQLSAGKQPSEIDVGFFDQAHLIRHFKRAYAVTPAAYARLTARTS